MTTTFHYIAPHLFPIFPEEMGETIVGADFETVLMQAATEMMDIDLTLKIETFMDGNVMSSETEILKVRDKKVSPRFIRRTYTMPRCGYVVLSLTAPEPYFHRLKPEFGYAILRRPDGGFTTIIAQAKYAVHLIIDAIRETGTFCLVHPSHYMDRARNTGNSAFLVNPYEGQIVARIAAANGRVFKHRLNSNSAELVSLEPVLEDGVPNCVMYTGNNRLIGWDVRHKLDESGSVYNVDHLEYYRAYPTMENVGVRRRAEKAVRRALRRMELWF
ncbi:MAG: hypothetical protein RIC16_16780 [Rhodospirillales bacterium]